MMMITFGPVPYRRLGRSLGINNIPPEICTYSCVYCRVGRTIRLALDRREFYQWEKIIEDVRVKIKKALASCEHIDYLTFVPDGKPTLDINLGRKIIRPHPRPKLENILKGALAFSRVYHGDSITETMLVKHMNDDESLVVDVAMFLPGVKPASVYLAIPARPPAVSGIQVPDEAIINSSYQLFSKYLDHVEYLIGYEGDAFAYNGQVEDDILSISAVHPSVC